MMDLCWLRKICSLGLMGLIASVLPVDSVWSADSGVLYAIENEISAILDVNRPGVVRIHALYPQDRTDNPTTGAVFTHGTGFIFDARGYILTIDAAVQGAEEIHVFLASDRRVLAHLVGADPISGVAVIRAEAEGLPTVKIGNSDRIRIGHYAFILGNDFGNLVAATGSINEIYQDSDLFQVSARVQSSYGGAPVFCSNGQVGGMVWRYEDPFQGIIGTNHFMPSFLGFGGLPTSVFVIPINRAMIIANKLVANGAMVYGWLGVEVVVKGNNMVVQDVALNSPAKLGGLKAGDIMLALGDQKIAGPHHLKHMVMENAPGTQITVSIRRNGHLETCLVTLGTLPPQPVQMASQPVPDFAPKDAEIYQQINQLQQEMGRLLQILNR